MNEPHRTLSGSIPGPERAAPTTLGQDPANPQILHYQSALNSSYGPRFPILRQRAGVVRIGVKKKLALGHAQTTTKVLGYY